MPFKAKNLKGTRDYSPSEVAKRNYMKNTISHCFELFGFQPIETPSFEAREFLEGLYGDEAETLIFKLLNSGEKVKKANVEAFQKGDIPSFISSISDKALRYDLTIPLSRYVAQHQNEINFPFKRYQIQTVWRADRPQYGRLQEFIQCDADIIGRKSVLNEIDMLLLMDLIFDKLKLKNLTIKINHRQILEAFISAIGASNQFNPIVIELDKLEKIGLDKVISLLRNLGLNDTQLHDIKQFIAHPDGLENFAKQSTDAFQAYEELQSIKSQFEDLSSNDLNIKIEPTLVRGLNYYTGMILEVVSHENPSIGSLAAGGRYDNLTAKFGLQNVSGMGISLGFERIQILLEQQKEFPENIFNKIKVMFLNFGTPYINKAVGLTYELRLKGIKVEVYPNHVKLSKQLTYANSIGVENVVFHGPDEEKNRIFLVKDMISGKQKSMGYNELLGYFISIQ